MNNGRVLENMQETTVDENDLKRAFNNREFTLVYQPQINLTTGEMIGVEALIRWKRNNTFISPEQFIPLAEQSGLIIPIGEWILRSACRQIKVWNERIDKNLVVGVNISPVQFHSSGFIEMVKKVLYETEINPENLELEITENMAMDVEKTVPILKNLKELGTRISIDDFGKGYSSLYYLKRFSIDKLKIDKSFVQDIESDLSNADVVEMIIMMAHKLKLKVIAEGVETREQLVFLQQLLCDEAQGYYLCKPLSPEYLEKRYLAGSRFVHDKDILQDKSAFSNEKQLRVDEQDLKNLVRYQAGMIFKFKKVENEFIYTMADGKLLSQIGLNKENAIGKNVEEIFPSDLWLIKRTSYEKAWQGELVDYELYVNDIYLFITLQPVIRAGEVVEVIGTCLDITQRKKMEVELEKTKGTLETIWNNTADPIFLLGLNGGIIKANPAFEKLLGWTFEDVKGLVPPPFILHSSFHTLMARLKSGEVIQNNKFECVTIDGQGLNILASYVPIKNEEILAVGMYKDVTKEKVIQKKIEESEEKYRSLVESSPEAIFLHINGKVMYSNNAGLNLVGASTASQILGKSVLDFVHPDSREMLENRMKEMQLNRSKLEFAKEKFKTLEGQTITTEVTALPIVYQGKQAVQVIVRDVTEKEKAEEALRKSEELSREMLKTYREIITG